AGFTVPILEYDRGDGCAITGGTVYRGQALPELAGLYFFADYCTASVRSIRWQGRQVFDHWDWTAALDPGGGITRLTSFGHDQAGELYLVSSNGTIWQLRRKPMMQ
ncbi:MAG: glucose dehydrogenase, partial [Myxococcota bacterium]